MSAAALASAGSPLAFWIVIACGLAMCAQAAGFLVAARRKGRRREDRR
jgi:hypothetical protein